VLGGATTPTPTTTTPTTPTTTGATGPTAPHRQGEGADEHSRGIHRANAHGGGPGRRRSSEHEVSLSSGASVSEGLVGIRHEVLNVEIGRDEPGVSTASG